MTQPRANLALVVDDNPMQGYGVIRMIQDMGFVVQKFTNVSDAKKFLLSDPQAKLVTVALIDKELKENPDSRPMDGVGSNFILDIQEDFSWITHRILYTTIANPTLGDVRAVHRTGASALAVGLETDQDKVIQSLKLIIGDHYQILSPIFNAVGEAAVKHQNFLDPVEYYLVRLIAEGCQNKEASERLNVSEEITSELMKIIYRKMNAGINGFASLQPRHKRNRIVRWYHDDAKHKFGVARIVPYRPYSQRRNLWPECHSYVIEEQESDQGFTDLADDSQD